MIYNNEFIIPEEYILKPNNNVDLDWMINKDGLKRYLKKRGNII